ncbi:MAG: hypothetical protein ACXWLS_05920 [Myxococcaceae bacterium]
MTRRARVLAVLSAAVGTGLLAGAFVLMMRAEAPTWAMLVWGVVALVAVTAFLVRFRPQRIGEALGLAGSIALAQTIALHLVLPLLLGGAVAPVPTVLRRLAGFALLDALTLVGAAIAGHWFPHRPSSR